ncbi:MAG TPA: hypothetical protein VMY05_01820 [Acidobacteriota bacterium]|nr:hypothetical protein [Acidobacteriota bacterium]
MRVTVLAFMLCCFAAALACSQQKTDSIRSNPPVLSGEVMQLLKDHLDRFDYVNLAFSVSELLTLLKEDTSLRAAWVEKSRNQPGQFELGMTWLFRDKEVNFFYDMLDRRKDLHEDYGAEIAFLKENRPELPGYRLIADEEYAEIVGKRPTWARNPDNSAKYYGLLIIEGEQFIERIARDEEAVAAFRDWLDYLEGYEFVVRFPFGISERDLIERKRQYVLDTYADTVDELMKAAVERIRTAQIREIE